MPAGSSTQVGRGDTLDIAAVTGSATAYLAVRGGIDVPAVLGSRSTFLRGPFGGEVTSTSYALNVVKDGESFVVTEGSAFEAGDYTFTPDGKGGLVQANPYADGPLELHRCP